MFLEKQHIEIKEKQATAENSSLWLQAKKRWQGRIHDVLDLSGGWTFHMELDCNNNHSHQIKHVTGLHLRCRLKTFPDLTPQAAHAKNNELRI